MYCTFMLGSSAAAARQVAFVVWCATSSAVSSQGQWPSRRSSVRAPRRKAKDRALTDESLPLLEAEEFAMLPPVVTDGNVVHGDALGLDVLAPVVDADALAGAPLAEIVTTPNTPVRRPWTAASISLAGDDVATIVEESSDAKLVWQRAVPAFPLAALPKRMPDKESEENDEAGEALGLPRLEADLVESPMAPKPPNRKEGRRRAAIARQEAEKALVADNAVEGQSSSAASGGVEAKLVSIATSLESPSVAQAIQRNGASAEEAVAIKAVIMDFARQRFTLEEAEG